MRYCSDCPRANLPVFDTAKRAEATEASPIQSWNARHPLPFRFLKAMVCIGLLAGSLALGGCDQQERREIRQQKERIAAEDARQQRLSAQYAADLNAETRRRANVLAAETQRRKDTLVAETDRQFSRSMSALGQLTGFLITIGCLFALAIYSMRRLGERHLKERTKRHMAVIAAIEAASDLKPDQRHMLYRAAIDSMSRGRPLLGPGTGGA